MKKRTKADNEAIHEEALTRFENWTAAWSTIYEKAREDIRFVDDDDGQWTEEAKAARAKRPMMTFDKTSQALDQVIGDHLQNRPGGKIRGTEDDDANTAEVYEGLVRQIESRGKRAYSTGFKFAAKGGFGVWMLDRDFVAEDSFDQDIILRRIKNPFSVVCDPIIQTGELDQARGGFLFNDMDEVEFKRQWPDATVPDGQTLSNGRDMPSGWYDKDTVRVAQYFRLVPYDRQICQLSTGAVVDKEEFAPVVEEWAAQGVTVKRERTVKAHRLECFKLTAAEILEEAECIGSYVPLIPIFGKQSNIDGKMVVRGLVRKAQDPQRLYNYMISSMVEIGAMSPRQQIMVTPNMIKGVEDKWRDINVSNSPVLFYNDDKGQKPQRIGAAQLPPELMTAIQLSSDGLKSATSIYDASLGARSNETSGRAIAARQREGDTGNYEFTDELAEAIEHTLRIMVEWIPLTYDATRQIRMLGEDDTEEIVEINKPMIDQQTGEEYILNDLSRGRYDVKVDVGPAYATRRAETADQMAQILQGGDPEITALMTDVYLRQVDAVGMDEVHDRLRKHNIKKGIIEPTEEEMREMQKKQAQQPPNPQQQMMQQVTQEGLMLDLEEKRAKVEKTKSEAELNRTKTADLKFDAATRTLVPMR